MKISVKLSFAIVMITVCHLAAEAISAQTERLGDIRYSPPKGWVRSAKEYAVVFSTIDQKAGNFCFITIYAAAPGTGNPQQDFAAEWSERAIKPWRAQADPKTVTEKIDGWTAIAGGGPIDFQGNKAFAFLNVLSGYGKKVSVLGILNDDSFLPQFQAFVESMNVDKTVTDPAAAPATSSASTTGSLKYDAWGHLIIPPPTRQLTAGDLAGKWGQNDGINTRYVYRSSGDYAGFDSLHFTNTMTLTAAGGYFNDFFAIQNGRKIQEDTKGTFAVAGRIFVLQDKTVKKYVIRGWLELPDMTIFVVCGPWYGDDAIPQEIFNNPDQGANLDQKWVRKK